MKRYSYIILLAFCLFLIILNIDNVNASLPLSGKLIFIDPGHGGVDPGTLSGSVLEKDLNLEISLFLEEELAKLGASVLLTRRGDYDLSSPNTTWRKKSDFDNRINLINESMSDLYLSIHMNFLNNSSYSGPQVFYDKNNLELAEIIQKVLNEELQSKRDVKKIPDTTYMYNKLEVSGVLIECGFLSNESEKNKLINVDYQKKIANLIALAISEYY